MSLEQTYFCQDVKLMEAKKQTIESWLRKLRPDLAEKAIKYAKETKYRGLEELVYGPFSRVLGYSFRFYMTDEGNDFWRKIWGKAIDLEFNETIKELDEVLLKQKEIDKASRKKRNCKQG